jgi:hypothetical protein
MPAKREKSPRPTKPARKKPASANEPLKRFYAGLTLPCPVGCGGTAQVILVNSRPDGGGEAWMECISCVQRGRLEIPRATPREKKQVAALLEEGQEALCVRHAERTPLRTRGRMLVCPACGVVFRGG